MSSNAAELQWSPLDRAIAVGALVLVAGGVVGFYQLESQSLIVRMLALIVGLVAAIGLMSVSAPGKRLLAFGRESVTEAKRVVWPSRKETSQTTLAVFVFVLVMAVFLWVTDKSLEWVLYDLILGWKR